MSRIRLRSLLPWVAATSLFACGTKHVAPSAAPSAAPGIAPSIAPGAPTAATATSTTAAPAIQAALAPASPATPAPTVANVTLAEVGLEATSLDRSVDPCVDFFEFACGGWVNNNPIPADKAQWSRFGEVAQRNEALLKTLLEEAAATAAAPRRAIDAPTNAVADALGTYYGACMDTTAIGNAKLSAIAPLLKKVRAVKDAKSWLAAITEMHRAGVWAVWNTSADADLKDSRKYALYLDSAGLGLPDRDYYFDANFAGKVQAYRDHVQRMLLLGGAKEPAATAGANDVVTIETALAKLTKTGEARRDLPAMYNAVNRKALAKTVASVDWKGYFKALSVPNVDQVVMTTPAFFAALDGLRKTIPAAAWANYFTYHLLKANAFALPAAFDDEAFALEKALSGVEQQRDRYKRCIASTEGSLEHLVGQAYVAKAFPGASKTRAAELINAIVAAMDGQIAALDWMSGPTKTIAQDKLKHIARMIGFPDTWRPVTFALKAGDFAGNRLRAMQAETKRTLARAGKPVDRNDWLMGAFEVNAYYNPSANNTALPAGILQAPFFGQDRSMAANLGGIGMVIGHELTHGFDDQGAMFDATGNMKNWWSPADLTAFTNKGRCLADQYATFEVLPKQFINGKLTLGENIADLGGVKMAFTALQQLRSNAADAVVADGFTEAQQFFLGVGQAWCSAGRNDDVARRLKTDAHSPPKYRIYGALRNLPEFAAAFSCPVGTPMHPAKTCSIW